MNSFNHYAYGAVGDWLYKVVAGIDFDARIPGYKRIKINPHPGNVMSNVMASHESPYGTIVSEWEIKNNMLLLRVEIPANTTAEVLIPSTDNNFSKNGKSGVTGEKVTREGLSYHFLKAEIGYGKYVFETPFQFN